MRFTRIILTLLVGASLTGCKSTQVQTAAPEGRELLTVDFQQGRILRYKFVSDRNVHVDWDPENKSPRSRARADDTMTEKLEMVVSYTPKAVDPFGTTTLEARIDSIKATRTGRSGSRGRKDAVEHAVGRTYTVEVGPTGKIEDPNELDTLIKEIGEKAFRQDARQGRIKEPDMIGDFVVTQWFLWDAVSSIEDPTEGVAEGQSWKSKLSVPAPMVMRKARDVTYTLQEIRPGQKGRVAIITSTHTAAESAPRDWPIPYSGRFQMAGTFGFLSGYKLLELDGEGRNVFNIDRGRMQQYDHQYQMKLKAFIPLGIDIQPLITIKQKVSMELLN